MKRTMKFFAIILLTSLALISCQSNRQPQELGIGELGENDCKLTKMTYNFAQSSTETTIDYNDNNQVILFNRKTDGYKERFSKLMYDENGAISKFEVYLADTLFFYETFSWKGNLSIVSFYGLEENVWVNRNKIALTYDEKGFISLLDDYTLDANNVWALKGTLYDYIWSNGNLVESSNYIVVKDSNKTDASFSNYDEYLLFSIDDEEYIVDNYSDLELFYTSEFEYSDFKNPLFHLSVAKTMVPNEYNCSRNIPKKITKTYDSGEIIVFNYEVTSNEKGYPISITVTAEYTGNNESLAKEFTVDFEYDNCQ